MEEAMLGLPSMASFYILVIGLTTVYTHVSNILAKLHLASHTQADLYAFREGYVSLYDESGESSSG